MEEFETHNVAQSKARDPIFKDFKFNFKGLSACQEENYHRIAELFGANFPDSKEYTMIFKEDFKSYESESSTTVFYDLAFIADCIVASKTLDINKYHIQPQKTICFMAKYLLRVPDCQRYFISKFCESIPHINLIQEERFTMLKTHVEENTNRRLQELENLIGVNGIGRSPIKVENITPSQMELESPQPSEPITSSRIFGRSKAKQPEIKENAKKLTVKQIIDDSEVESIRKSMIERKNSSSNDSSFSSFEANDVSEEESSKNAAGTSKTPKKKKEDMKIVERRQKPSPKNSFKYCKDEKNRCKIPDCMLARVAHDRHGIPTRNFMRCEEDIMIKYLINNCCISVAKGNKVWQDMINEGFLRHRTVQSLQNNFRRSILPKLSAYRLPKHIEQQFQSLKK